LRADPLADARAAENNRVICSGKIDAVVRTPVAQGPFSLLGLEIVPLIESLPAPLAACRANQNQMRRGSGEAVDPGASSRKRVRGEANFCNGFSLIGRSRRAR